jgi:uncharacterized membrane protein YkvA (DUF1232 family)
VTRLRAVAGFLPDCIVLFARLARDPRTGRSLTLLLVVSGAYLAFPFDLIPDFIPVLGLVDDAILIALVLRFALRRAGPEVVREHWPGPESTLAALQRLLAPPN